MLANTIVSEKVTIKRDGPTHTQVWKFDSFTEAIALAQNQIGGYITIGGIRQFVLPSYSLLIPGLYLNQVDIEPWESSLSSDLSTAMARVTVVFARLEHETEEAQDLGEESLELGVQEIDLPHGSYEWAEGTKNGETLKADTDAKPRKQFALGTYSLKLNNYEGIPKDTVRGLLGKTNSGSYRGFSAGELLYQGAQSSRQVSSDGTQTTELTHKFGWNPEGWGRLWDGEQFSRVSPGLYESASFGALEP